MKKIITLLMVITMIFSLSACGEPSGQHQDMVSTLDTVSDLQERQPTPTDLDFSLERYNLIRRALLGQRAARKGCGRGLPGRKAPWIHCALY